MPLWTVVPEHCIILSVPVFGVPDPIVLIVLDACDGCVRPGVKVAMARFNALDIFLVRLNCGDLVWLMWSNIRHIVGFNLVGGIELLASDVVVLDLRI